MATTRAIDLRTGIPGPRSAEILARKERVVAEPLTIFLPVVIERGEGATLTDVDGNTFIDFTGGVGCLNVGHSNPRIVEAAQEQLARFTHTDFTIVPYENYVRLAERLVELVPISGDVRAAFFNSGAEAVENAIKFARSYTKRPAVLAFEGGFHGRTLLALSLTSKTHPYKAGLGPFAPEVYRLPFAPVVGRAEIMNAPPDSGIGGTYVGNPVAQAAALAVLDVFEEEGLVERAAAIGETIRARMQSWQERWERIGDVRGLGAMLAIELVADRATKEPDADVA